MKVIVNIDDSVSTKEIQSWIDEVLMKMPPVMDAHIACKSCTCDDSKYTGVETMKGLEIKRENEKPMYIFGRSDVVSAIAHAIYYTANPESEMCIPNCAYERAEKEFDDWFNDTRIKKALKTLSEKE